MIRAAHEVTMQDATMAEVAVHLVARYDTFVDRGERDRAVAMLRRLPQSVLEQIAVEAPRDVVQRLDRLCNAEVVDLAGRRAAKVADVD